MTTIRRVYASLYGTWFSLTVASARKFANQIKSAGYADLDDFGKELKHRPRCVYGTGRSASSWDSRALVIRPIDYDADDAEMLLDSLS